MEKKNFQNEAKENVLNKMEVCDLGTAPTSFTLGSNPIIHNLLNTNKLSEEEFYELFSFTANRLAGVIQTGKKEDWFQLECFFRHFFRNKPENILIQPDTQAVKSIFHQELEEDI